MLPAQQYPGRLSFATDAWTSPNHRSFVAITIHLELKGKPLRMLLDLVELAKVRTTSWSRIHIVIVSLQSHTGVNLATTFNNVLLEFGIQHKVSSPHPSIDV